MPNFMVNNFDSQHLENTNITCCFRGAGSYSTVESYVVNIHYTTYADGFEFWNSKFMK